MPARLNVVVSQSRSQNPKKRAIEERIVGELLGSAGIDVAVVPHLYDLSADGPGMLSLSGISGDLVFCSWLFPRAARWTLDRNGIRGQEGTTLLKSLGEDDEEEEEDSAESEDSEAEEKPRVIDQRELPARKIYCLDLRAHDSADDYLEEIRRIAGEASTQTVELMGWIKGDPKPEQLARYLANGDEGESGKANGESKSSEAAVSAGPIVVEEDPARRWYPVIDFSRCTNCLECIDFCLFGVYGMDGQETILVEQPDNCRKGCPACSRVCPENAIIFPEHKTPTIAGSPEIGGPMKIDLSQLFGAPDPGAPGAEKAHEVAARERDEQLMAVGRDAVGMAVGLPKRQAATTTQSQTVDELDLLIDSLDEIDL
ncbi:ATP-binding protein [Adhaeretor mobilis]|uniref:4Fe-4S ferredoxin-type domain-containing protein n=1 Tax=Adhaeretor mobilis TaxID=1930276 RepID=A0A517N016_9BACT|nr:ferredoxin family protein [Adhaeretor mobilis]QDT00444.1 hypothetical protein HG15A2_37820 [Adhaeretor mobilis]